MAIQDTTQPFELTPNIIGGEVVSVEILNETQYVRNNQIVLDRSVWDV
jgi:hypothetical protein